MVTGYYRKPQHRVYTTRMERMERMYSVGLIMVQGLERVDDRDDLVYQVWNLLSYGRRSSKCSVLRLSYRHSNSPEPDCKNAGQAEPDSLIQGTAEGTKF